MLELQLGTANALYTAPRTFHQGTYLVSYYNCLSAASQDNHIVATAEASGGHIAAGWTTRLFSQMGLFNQTPFVLKVRSSTAVLRFKVYHGGSSAATITHSNPTCAHFQWTQIGL